MHLSNHFVILSKAKNLMKTFADDEILLRFAYQDDNGRRFSADT